MASGVVTPDVQQSARLVRLRPQGGDLEGDKRRVGKAVRVQQPRLLRSAAKHGSRSLLSMAMASGCHLLYAVTQLKNV